MALPVNHLQQNKSITPVRSDMSSKHSRWFVTRRCYLRDSNVDTSQMPMVCRVVYIRSVGHAAGWFRLPHPQLFD